MILRLLFDAPHRGPEPAHAERQNSAAEDSAAQQHPQIPPRSQAAIDSARLPAQQ
jgi:hypothetical protein